MSGFNAHHIEPYDPCALSLQDIDNMTLEMLINRRLHALPPIPVQTVEDNQLTRHGQPAHHQPA